MSLLALALLALPAPGAVQAPKDGAARRPDPYSEDAPELRKLAGYVSYGPFPLAKDDARVEFGTRDVEKALGDIEILWVETAHFRIGSTLPAYVAEDKKERDKLRLELAELRRIFPQVDPEQRKLDPWLRLHLYARRLEDLYADFQRRLGRTDADFPAGPGTLVNGEYRGDGPYLGQPGKYVLLLFEKSSSVGRFFGRFTATPEDRSRRHNFPHSGTLLMAISTEYGDGALKNDTALHCSVVFNQVHNLVSGYKFYTVELPIWWKEGLAHWYARRVDPSYNNFSAVTEEAAETRSTWNWPPKVRGRVKNDYYPGAAELTAWTDFDGRRLADHMMMWSRVDYLMSLGDAGFATFMDMMKGSYPGITCAPTPEQVLARQQEALQQAWSLDADAFDRQWAEYVLKTYPGK
ncbi:MAG: hypothetical protein EYC70_15495 [Planctomycetota bacterium]|nr:MAG: hypothetical protein EYC70_15495 [Planctomycetota bacterium]